jgi:hypothetical protein
MLRGSKGEGFFRSPGFRPGHCRGLRPGAFLPPPRSTLPAAGMASASPRHNPRNDEGLSQSPLQKTSPFPPSCLGVSMSFHPSPGHPVSLTEPGGSVLERRRRGNRLKERDLEARNRLGSAVPGAPDLKARGGSKPPWCNSPKGVKRARTLAIPAQGGRFRRHRTLVERRREGFPRCRSGPENPTGGIPKAVVIHRGKENPHPQRTGPDAF